MEDLIAKALEQKALEDLVHPEPPKKIIEPELTLEAIEEAIALLMEVELHGGFGNIAALIGFERINKRQVTEIYEKMQKRVQELAPILVEEPILEEPVEEPVGEPIDDNE